MHTPQFESCISKNLAPTTNKGTHSLMQRIRKYPTLEKTITTRMYQMSNQGKQRYNQPVN